MRTGGLWMAAVTTAALLTAGCGASARAHTLEFEITGDAELSTLTYVVDGKTTRLESVRLPWKKKVHLPPKDGKHTWKLSSKQDGGTSQIVVYVDGRTITSTSCAGDGCNGGADGSVGD